MFSLQDLYFLIVVALVRADRFLPDKVSAAIPHLIAFLALTFSRSKRCRARNSLGIAFQPPLTTQQSREILSGTFYSVWREMFSWSARFDPASCARRVEFRGKEHLENALRQGRGAILWESNALGCRLLAKKTLYAHGFAVHQVHGPDNLGGLNTDNKNATWVRRVWLKPFFDEREEQFTAGLIDLPHANSLAFTRRMVECLERNEILCVAGDGAFGHKKIKLCFLGHPTPFATGLVSLARLTRTPVLPMFCLRARNDGAVLEIRAPLTIPDGAERTALTRELVEQYATQLEARVRQAPGQYRNWHLLGTDQVKRP